MGLYDRVEFDESVFDLEPEREWQTKQLQAQPLMETFRVDADGHLYKEVVEFEHVPEEERPKYDEEIGGFHEEWHRAMGMMQRKCNGWEQWDDYHGRFGFHGVVDGVLRYFEATFTHGELESIDEVD